MSYFSFNSSTDITDIFKAMFQIVLLHRKKKFGPNILSYLNCFGIAPYFKQQVIVELKEMQCFVLSFDESLYNEFHREQKDLVVKYFNKDRVVCMHLTSRFLCHTCAEDLKKASKN